ncbi:uncharacterized protein [Anabrus simplex]|uniref:uncharacterized protein n=1 Tax=Anabrus simplex TaxID=316456 RepID=UPI0034DD80D3
MSPYGYVQFFLLGLLCTGAVSAETATCTNPRAQSNIDMNQVYGDWFLGKAHGPATLTEDKSQCYTITLTKFNETTLEITSTYPGQTLRKVFTIENSENPGTWQAAGEERTVQVIYLSTDFTIMAIAGCIPNHAEPVCILISKQLPISSEKIEEVLHAVEHAGMSGHHHHFTWESEATCPSA